MVSSAGRKKSFFWRENDKSVNAGFFLTSPKTHIQLSILFDQIQVVKRY
jgi:hypothetical protein